MTRDERAIERRLDERYGRRRSRRAGRATWLALGAVAVAVVGAASWVTVDAASRTADATTTAFRIIDDRAIELSFQVTAPAGASFACAIEAQDVEHGVVGWRVVEYDAPATRPVALVETVPTLALATTVLVNACWVT